MNNIILSSTKVIKDLKIFIAKNFEWNHQINYLYRIAATTSFKDLKSFKSTDINNFVFFYHSSSS